MRITDPHGSKWRVGRRVLPWRTRGGIFPSLLWAGLGLTFSEAFYLGLFVLAFAVPFLLGLVVAWLLSVLLLPFVTLFQTIGLCATKVVAYRLNDKGPLRRRGSEKGFKNAIFDPLYKVRRYRVSADEQQVVDQLVRRIQAGLEPPADPRELAVPIQAPPARPFGR